MQEENNSPDEPKVWIDIEEFGSNVTLRCNAESEDSFKIAVFDGDSQVTKETTDKDRDIQKKMALAYIKAKRKYKD